MLKRSLLIALTIAVTIACGGPTVAPKASSTPTAKATAQAQPLLSSHMTKGSGVHGIPLPDDCAPISGGGGLCTSQVGTVSAITAFYKSYMGQRGGWTFEPGSSVMDPDVGVTKSMGYTTTQFWCQ